MIKSRIEGNLNDHLSTLTVKGKLSNIVTFKEKEHTWKKIVNSVEGLENARRRKQYEQPY